MEMRRSLVQKLATAYFFLLLVVFVSGALGVRVYAQEPYEKIASKEEWEMLEKINEYRLKRGCNALSMFKKLQSAADIRVNDNISLNGEISHTRPNGKSCFNVLSLKNISYMSAAENIAAGQESVSAVMSAWHNSPGHRANMQDKNLQHIGCGFGSGGDFGTYWVQLFVGGCKVTDISVGNASQDVYPVGTKIGDMDRYLIIKCSDHGTSYAPITARMCSGYQASVSGWQNIKVKFQGRSVTMKVFLSGEGAGKPDKVKGLKVTRKGKKAVLKWTKTDCDGYEVYMSSSSKSGFKRIKTITSADTVKYTKKGIAKTKKKYFKVRAYKLQDGKKVYGAMSAVKALK